MNREQVFSKARSRLAIWYAGVMGTILCLSGIGSYLVMAHAHWESLDRELTSVAGTIHDTLEPVLDTPTQISPLAKKILLKLCLADNRCQTNKHRHILGGVHQEGYYLRLSSLSGILLATIGKNPTGNIPLQPTWQTVTDAKGERYHQVSLLVKTANNQDWGYIQVGRSLNDYEQHLLYSKLLLVIGLPIALIFTSLAGWWLSDKAMKPVYNSYQQMQQFTADAAHELRTPLAAIQATTESVLRMDTLSEIEARDTLKTIERQNNRISQLVKDLLLLSRMDLNMLEVKLEPCCLNDILSDLIEELSSLAVGNEISLSLNTCKHQSKHQFLIIVGNEEQLYRLFSNLITNGIRYTNQAGKVEVTLLSHEHHAEIVIQDNGIGIAEADQPKIFERFYRVNSDRSRITGGSGLGLAIAKAITQRHKGTIQVKSNLGKGSTFKVLLPLA